jgi:hypothetical protein
MPSGKGAAAVGVPGSRFQVSGSRFQVSGFRFQVSGFRFKVREMTRPRVMAAVPALVMAALAPAG